MAKGTPPDKRTITKFEFTIGGFSQGHHWIELVDDRIVVKVVPGGNIISERTPSNEEWSAFLDLLDVCNVWKWKAKYNDPFIDDGTQWELQMEGEGLKKKLKIYGSNKYPDKFDRLKEAISELSHFNFDY